MDVWIYVSLIAIFAGIVKGISGFGSSLVAIPLLTLVFGREFVDESVVVMVTFNLALNALLLVENKGFNPDSLRKVWVISLFGSMFTILGIYILVTVPEYVISYIAGSLIIVAVINKAFRLEVPLKETFLTKAIVGTLSGVGNGIASIDGPPVVFYLTNIKAEKKYFKNALAAHFLIMGIVAVIFHIIWGNYTVDLFILTAVMIVFTILGLLIGNRVSRHMDQVIFDRIVLIVMVALAISLFI